VIWRSFRGARDEKWTKLRFNGGRCDAKGPLIVLYLPRLFYYFLRPLRYHPWMKKQGTPVWILAVIGALF